MAKTPAKHPSKKAKQPAKPLPDDVTKPPRILQLGPWLHRLGKKPVELAKEIGKGESYISLLISHKKQGTPAVLLDISEALGVSVNALYRLPPPIKAVDTVRNMSAAERADLARALEALTEPKSEH